MDDDVSHAVNERLVRIEDHLGLGPIGEDEETDVVEERDAEEEAD